MNSELKPCINLPLDKALLDDIGQKAKDWALMHGMWIINIASCDNTFDRIFLQVLQ